MKPKIYIAGPDVFRLDWPEFARQVMAVCEQHGVTPIFPIPDDENMDQPGLEGVVTQGSPEMAQEIMLECISSIHSADAIIANLTPFRGDEPDSGTVFEVATAYTLGKPVVGYTTDNRTIMERHPDAPVTDAGGRVDRQGCLIEHFGLPCNLMVAQACTVMVNDVAGAIAAVVQIFDGHVTNRRMFP